VVDLGHRAQSRLGVDDGFQLSRQAREEGARLLRLDDAVLLAALEVEIEPVEPDPVGDGPAPVDVGDVRLLLLAGAVLDRPIVLLICAPDGRLG
jgi:hypothetical protein